MIHRQKRVSPLKKITALVPPGMKRRIILLWQRFLDRYKLNDLDRIYSEEMFTKRLDGVWCEDIERFCKLLYEEFHPASVADVGCGPGAYLRAFQSLGTRDVFGLEGTEPAIKHAMVSDIVQHDLREPVRHVPQYELVLCVEVAEHIHQIYADTLIASIIRLCRSGGHIVFAAAGPGQTGRHHINLQPRTYWLQKFQDRGCVYLMGFSARLRDELDLERIGWLRENSLVFRMDRDREAIESRRGG